VFITESKEVLNNKQRSKRNRIKKGVDKQRSKSNKTFFKKASMKKGTYFGVGYLQEHE
jgi:hypothetical protein